MTRNNRGINEAEQVLMTLSDAFSPGLECAAKEGHSEEKNFRISCMSAGNVCRI